MTSPTNPTIEQLLSIAETQRLLGIGRTTLYALVKEGRLPIVKIGRRSLISARQVALFIGRLSEQRHSDGTG